MQSFVSPPDRIRAAGRQQQAFVRIEEQLMQFEKITLAEMDAVQLQDRMGTKLIFHLNRLPFFLSEMKREYQVFEINNIRLNPYQTLYFDDENWKLYHMHHNEKTNRFKLRFRSYLSSDLNFFEIKYKNNKGRTIKERIRVPEITTSIEGKSKELLSEVVPENSAVFNPKLWVNYSRITFVSKQKTERVTIDLNLIYKNKDKELALTDLVIAEVKQGRASTESPFLKLMKNNGIRPGSISKYCLGVMMLENEVKKK
jgi:hypothetical protein